jgi:hypothetical protein
MDTIDREEVLAMLNDCHNLQMVNVMYSNALETKESGKGLLIPYTKAYFERFYDLKKQINSR